MFPHSEICGSKLICSSPQLIAACHVLHRLLMPRHPLCALVRLNFYRISFTIFSVLSRLNCCVSRFTVTLAFSKIVYLFTQLSLERPDLSSYLFPLLIKSVRVLNSFPIQFSMINRRSEPALSSIFIGLLSYSSFTLNPLKDRLKSKLVGSSGLEPPTSRLSGARSNQLSYEPISDRGLRHPRVVSFDSR